MQPAEMGLSHSIRYSIRAAGAGIVLLAACVRVCVAGSVDLGEAERLLRSGETAQALTLLEAEEAALAGDARFDALLGSALLRSGQPARASLALERATVTDPSLAGARLDLAIAYYDMGAQEDARQTLLALRTQDPPAEAAQVIDDYLARIERGRAPRRLRFDLALASGYDSNANNAASLGEFLGFTLTPTSRATESEYYELDAGAGIVQPLRGGLALDAQLGLRQRVNPRASFVDSTGGDAALSLRHDGALATAAATLVGYRLDTDGEMNSRGGGIAARYDRALGPRLSLGGFARAIAVRYGEDLEVKDVDAVMGGIDVARALGSGARGAFRAGIRLGRDTPQVDDSPYGRTEYGVDASATWRFSARLAGRLALEWMRSDYDDPFFAELLAEPRADRLTQLRAGAEWAAGETWSLNAGLTLAQNETNVDLYAYDRVAIELAAVRRWR
jgi:hypothetical protein